MTDTHVRAICECGWSLKASHAETADAIVAHVNDDHSTQARTITMHVHNDTTTETPCDSQ